MDAEEAEESIQPVEEVDGEPGGDEDDRVTSLTAPGNRRLSGGLR